MDQNTEEQAAVDGDESGAMRGGTLECIIVGGGAAGLSAALVLGRARRKVMVVDAGNQSNLASGGIGGLLGHDTRPPAEFYASAHGELAAYPSVSLVEGSVEAIREVGSREGSEVPGHLFDVELADGRVERTSRVLLATGMTYVPPDIPGLAPLWGKSVFHCPFCHGWEHHDQAMGVFDPEPSGVSRALLLRNWSDNVTLFAGGTGGGEGTELDDVAKAALDAAGVKIETRPVAELRGTAGELAEVAFEDGSSLPCEAMLVAVTLAQSAPFLSDLGVETVEPNPMTADALAVDGQNRTSVPGIFAAGDLTGRMPSVPNAIASGSFAAASIVHSFLPDLG